MIERILIPAATAAISLGLTAFASQDKPSEAEKPTEAKVFVTTTNTKVEDSADALTDVYERLRVLRAQRLDERPKKLADQAAKLYRQAVEATEAGNGPKAKALTNAARDLTRALELSLKTNSKAPADPDLPPPPKRSDEKLFLYRYYNQLMTKGDEMPPALEEDGKPKDRLTIVKPTAPKDGQQTLTLRVHPEGKEPITTGNIRVRLEKAEGETAKRDVIVEKLPHDETQKIVVEVQKAVEGANSQVAAARVAAHKASEEVQTALELQLKAIKEKKDGQQIEVKLSEESLSRMKQAEAIARLHESLAGVKSSDANPQRIQLFLTEKAQSKSSDHDAALAELRRAYETILSARKEQKGDEGKTYLDAARDLYHSARREAEAKHFDRAAELALAAQAITRAHHAVGNVRVESRTIHGKTEVKVFHDDKQADAAKGEKRIFLAEPIKGKIEVRTEEKSTRDSKKPEADAGDTDEATVVGIGVMISFDEGKALVDGVVPKGPAARDGRIKQGDSILGILNESGSSIGFADKSLAEVTKSLRGPSGSKIKVVVQPKGTSDLKVYEIERSKLDLPQPAAPEAPAEPKAPAAPKSPDSPKAELPPILD